MHIYWDTILTYHPIQHLDQSNINVIYICEVQLKLWAGIHWYLAYIYIYTYILHLWRCYIQWNINCILHQMCMYFTHLVYIWSHFFISTLAFFTFLEIFVSSVIAFKCVMLKALTKTCDISPVLWLISISVYSIIIYSLHCLTQHLNLYLTSRTW